MKDRSLYLLTSDPVREIQTIRGESVELKKGTVDQLAVLSDQFAFSKAPIELALTFNQAENTRITFPSNYGIRLKNAKGEYITIGYNNLDKFFYVDRTHATGIVFSDKFAGIQVVPYIVTTPEIEWRFIIDVSSVEFFTAGGRIVITNVFYPSDPFDIIELFTENGKIDYTQGTITELHSIWK